MSEISASVGNRGANRSGDVKVVQELLNQISTDDGGPQRDLKVDGIVGPKTKNAIQSFQLHHFNWKGADGRVDPGHQTIKKLNELQPKSTPPGGTKPVPPPPPVKPVRKLGTTFVIQQPGKAHTVMQGGKEEFFFKVTDTTNQLAQLFWFGRTGGYRSIGKRPKFLMGGGVALTIFRVSSPGIALADFQALGGYHTRENRQGLKSQLVLVAKIDGKFRELRMNLLRHLIGRSSTGGSGTTVSLGGEFQIVDNPGRFIDRF